MILGICGGTFDPVHYGHLRSALEVMEALAPAEIAFVPNAQPPHRDNPGASPEQRLRMLEAAVGEQPGFYVDSRELDRGGPSWTVDTLASLREEYPDRSLCLLLGTDAFAALPGWKNGSGLLSLAHLVVMRRPGFSLPEDADLRALIAHHQVDDVALLHQRRAGCIYFQNVTALDISATLLRQEIRRQRSIRYLLPERVREIIEKEGLYGDSGSA